MLKEKYLALITKIVAVGWGHFWEVWGFGGKNGCLHTFSHGDPENQYILKISLFPAGQYSDKHFAPLNTIPAHLEVVQTWVQR